MAIDSLRVSTTRTGLEEPAHLPGVCRIFSLPCECTQRIREIYRAETLGDNEGVFENALRIVEIPFDMTTTLFNGLDLLFKSLLYFGFATSTPFLKTLSKSIPIISLIVGGFESFFELRSFKQAWDMLKVLKMPSEKALEHFKIQYCETPQMVKNITDFVNEAFAKCSEEDRQLCIKNYIQQANAARSRRLERRIGCQGANRFYQTINAEESGRLPKEILNDLRAQVQKQLLLHALGLIAALIAIAGAITLIYGCPFIVPLILVNISNGLTILHWALAEGMLPCKGWSFQASYLLPECLRKRFFTPSDAASPSLQGRVQSEPVLQSIPG